MALEEVESITQSATLNVQRCVMNVDAELFSLNGGLYQTSKAYYVY